jgi:hypothetical protein
MVRFTFVNGETKDFDYAWDKVGPKLQHCGIRMFLPKPGVLITLNSNTIIMVENFPEETEEVTVVDLSEPEPVVEPEPEKEPKKSTEDERERVLNAMKELSECTHEEREFYYQKVKSGPKGKQKEIHRYFPVCVKCGVRERYVKTATVSEEEQLNAKLWDK